MKRNLVLSLLAIVGVVLVFQNCSKVNFKAETSSLSSFQTAPPICRETTAPQIQPKLKWDWYAQLDKLKPENFPSFSQVMATPMVADLDGDGIPEVVFSTFSTVATDWFPDAPGGSSYQKNGVLRIVDGRTGANIKSIASAELAPYSASSPLLIDLDGDGKIEIVYPSYMGSKLIALNYDGSLRWTYASSGSLATFASLSAADFNRDGRSDIIAGKEVISETLSKMPYKLFELETGASVYQFGYSLDPNKPTEMQVVGGSGVFSSNGTKLFSLSSSLRYAVADLDPNRPGIEIAGSGGGLLQIMDGLNGNVIESLDLFSVSNLQCPSGKVGGGPPTIGDFDGDPSTLEIAVATGKFLAVFNSKAQLIAKYETQDCSSLATGISSFDFNGDGKPEILYGDEEYFRIFELHNGELRVISQIVNPSGTLLEYPVVVDVDGNGSSEIVVASNNYAAAHFYKDPTELGDADAGLRTTGVRAFEATESGSWMPTRSIWNQFDYNPALVTDRGRAVSSTPFDSFSTKLFRRNSQLRLFEPRCL